MATLNVPVTAEDTRPRQHRWPRLAPLLAALVLAGCSFAPTYERPALPVSTDWPITPSGAGVVTPAELSEADAAGVPVPAAAGVGWRQFYRDPELQGLIETALEHNRDLRIAILNIEVARAQYNVQRSELTPSVGVGATGQRQRVPAGVSPTGESTISSQYQVGVSMPSFEIDLFGRIRSLSDAALAQYLATEEARRNVQITLIAQVAEAWFNLYGTAAQSKLTEQTLASRQSSYDLVEARYEAGVGSALDLNQAETLLDTVRSNQEALRRQGMRARNALTQLTGVPSPTIPDDETLLRNRPVLAEIPAELPSSVLLSRPDVLAAEQQLIAANANIGAARAAFFPNISLTALFGTASAQLSNLFSGGTHTWSFAPQIAIPIFSGGALRSQLELAEVRRDIAVADYERTIQQAFREVSDALAGTATYNSQLQAETDLVAAAQRSTDLAQLRYDSGVDSYLQFQDAERTLYSSQQGLVQTRIEELLNRVALYKALGGGWLADTDGPPPALDEAVPEAAERSERPSGGQATPAATPTPGASSQAPAASEPPPPSLATTPASPVEATQVSTPSSPVVSQPVVSSGTIAQPTTTNSSGAVTIERSTWRDTVRGVTSAP